MTDSGFDAAAAAPIVARWWELAGRAGTPPVIADLDGFRQVVPPMTGTDYAQLAVTAYAARGASALYVGGSSGTTGNR